MSRRKALAYKVVELSAASTSSIVPPPPALTNYEEVLARARCYGATSVSAITSQLNVVGEHGLAMRVRALSRSRGAHAHPDLSLALEVVAALSRERNSPSGRAM